jgi:predicted secreted protein
MSAVAPVVTVTPSASAITNVQALPVAVAVAGAAGTALGTVQLVSGTYTSNPVTLLTGAATIVVPAGVLAVAADTLTVTYTPTGTSIGVYLTATGTGNVTVSISPVSLPSKLQGYKAQLTYVPASGGAAVVLAGLKDLDGGFKAEKLDATDHGNNGWKSSILGLLEFTGTAKVDFIAGDASQQYILNSMLAGAAISITIAPVLAPGSGVVSFVGPVIVSDWKWSGKNSGLQDATVTLDGNGPFVLVIQ